MTPTFDVIFCDDIRQEVTGKHMLIGMYSGDLVPGAMPSGFPLSLLIKVKGLTGKHTFEVTLSSPGGKHQAQMGGDLDVPDHVGAFPLVFVGMPVQLDEYGEITVDLSLDGKPKARIGSLGVSKPQQDSRQPTPSQ